MRSQSAEDRIRTDIVNKGAAISGWEKADYGFGFPAAFTGLTVNFCQAREHLTAAKVFGGNIQKDRFKVKYTGE